MPAELRRPAWAPALQRAARAPPLDAVRARVGREVPLAELEHEGDALGRAERRDPLSFCASGLVGDGRTAHTRHPTGLGSGRDAPSSPHPGQDARGGKNASIAAPLLAIPNSAWASCATRLVAVGCPDRCTANSTLHGNVV